MFLIVQYISQSQLAMVCFDSALQISAGIARQIDGETDRDKDGGSKRDSASLNKEKS